MASKKSAGARASTQLESVQPADQLADPLDPSAAAQPCEGIDATDSGSPNVDPKDDPRNTIVVKDAETAADEPTDAAPATPATAPGAPEDGGAPYPVQWEADVVLRDGSVAHIRPITPADGTAIQAMHEKQSEESIYLRFFAPIKRIGERDLYRFTHVDHDERVALVATVRDEIIGIARYDRIEDPTIAEVAFNISDAYHGRGVGSVMLEHLAVIGRESGIQRFIAEVLPQNQKMMKVFTDAGYEVEHHYDDGVISVRFRIEPTDRSEAVQMAREHRAEAQSIRALLSPGSIAVVGVSRRPDALGSVIFDNILDSDFQGALYVVNKDAGTVRGVRAYSRVSDIGEPVDLAVIAVPAEGIPRIVDDCAAAGVRGIVVFSSGFAEAGPAGEARQAELLARARAAGIRVVGPSSFGIGNNHPQVRVNAILARKIPAPGSLGLFAQSGGLGVGLLAAATDLGLGISVFASAGNRVDVSGNDMMQFFIDDDATSVVGMYLESIGNPRKFSRIARQLALRKPLIVVKTKTLGTVPPGHRARQSRVPERAFHATLDQAGVIRADSIRDMLTMARLAIGQPLPAGNRVAVIGNSAGTNALIAAHCDAGNLEVTRGPKTLPVLSTVDTVSAAVQAAFADPTVDSVITCFIPPMRGSDRAIARAITHASWGHHKPCVTSFMGMDPLQDVVRRAGEHVDGRRRVIPVYDSPLDAVRALAAMTKYALWRAADHGERVRPEGIDRVAALGIVERILEASPGGRRLTDDEARKLLATYGITLWPMLPARTPEEALAHAEQLGYPVVLRSMADSTRDLSGSQGVRHDLYTPELLRHAFAAMTEVFGTGVTRHLAVQPMARPALGTFLNSVEDPLFGPVVSFGMRGPASHLLGDVSHAVPPLTDKQVAAMIDGLATAQILLEGYRAYEAVARGPLEDLIGRVSVLADEIPEVASLQLNPVNVHTEGVDVLAAVVQVAPAGTRTDAGRRAMN